MTILKNAPLSLRRLYQLAFADGLALLVLVFVAVPLKRMADFPWLVKFVGPLHGALFTSLIMLVMYNVSQRLIKKSLGILMLLLAFVPFGAFYADYLLKKSFQLPNGDPHA